MPVVRRVLAQTLVIAGLLLFVFCSFMLSNIEWFPFWLLLLASIATLNSIAPIRTYIWGRKPWRGALLLVIGTFAFAIHSYYVELTRQKSQRLEIRGVQMALARNGHFRVGVLDSVDVHLEAADSSARWAIQLRPMGGSLALDSVRGVEGLTRRKHRWYTRMLNEFGFTTPYESILGWEVSNASGTLNLIRGPTPAAVTIEQRARTRILRLGRSEAVILNSQPESEQEDVLERRLQKRLRMGVRLNELQWQPTPDTSFSNHLVVTAVRDVRLRIPFLYGWRYRITSRLAELTTPADVVNRAAPTIEFGDTLDVQAAGRRWSFVVAKRSRGRQIAPDLAVLFIRGPDPRLAWLPSDQVCAPRPARCTMLSNRPLPPAIPYFDLHGFGLDTAKYRIFSRLSVTGESIRIASPTRVEVGPTDSLVYLQADPLRRFALDAGYVIKVHKLAQGELGGFVRVLAGLLLFLSGMLALCLTSNRHRALLTASTPGANAFWAVLSISIVLLGVRLALGNRISYAAPYQSRGIETAIGIWITLPVLGCLLFRWDAWGPGVIRGLLELEGRAGTYWPTASAHPGSGGFMREWLAALRTRMGRLWQSSRLWILIGMTGLVLLLSSYPKPVFNALTVTIAILAAWVAIDFLRARSSTDPSEHITAAEILRHERSDEDGARTFAHLLAVTGIPLVLFAKKFTFVANGALSVVLSLAAVAVIATRRKLAKERTAMIIGTPVTQLKSLAVSPAVQVQRWGAVTFVLGGIALFSVAAAKSDRPTILFVTVVFLFLLGVRLGQRTAEAMKAREMLPAIGALATLVGGIAICAAFDFGLGLVITIPLIITLVLSANAGSLPRYLVAGVIISIALAVLVAKPVMYPNVEALKAAQDPIEFDRAFRSLGGPLQDMPGIRTPVRRAVVRGLAAREPELLQRALVNVGPSLAREEILPALEQVWGGRAYASSKWTGSGFAGPIVVGRGVPEVVSYAENTFAVYVLGEHGFIGGFSVLLLYVLLLLSVLWLLLRVRNHPEALDNPHPSATAVAVGGVLLIVTPALYVAASNIGLVPLTGQNMPGLGLNAWSDVAFTSGVLSAVMVVLLDSFTSSNSVGPR